MLSDQEIRAIQCQLNGLGHLNIRDHSFGRFRMREGDGEYRRRRFR